MWILAAALVVAAAVAVALWFALRKARASASRTDELVEAARNELNATVTTETQTHVEEIRRVLARERADLLSQLADDERRRADERRVSLRPISGERSSSCWPTASRTPSNASTSDCRRSWRTWSAPRRTSRPGSPRWRSVSGRAIAEVEQRIEARPPSSGRRRDEQRRTVQRLRDELERAAGVAVTEALDELEAQTVERRRSIDEISERLERARLAISDGIERAETDARGRLDVAFVEFERRQLERLERVVAREIERHEQAAVLAFDERMREIREDAATRLARELDRAIDVIVRDELARRVDTAS